MRVNAKVLTCLILVALLLFQPIFLSTQQSTILLSVLLVVGISMVSPVTQQRYWMVAKYTLIALMVGLSYAYYTYHATVLIKQIYVSCFVLLLVWGIYTQIRDLISHKTVEWVSIIHAISIYMLIGYLFASISWLVELTVPGSYYISNESASHELHDFVYFSFVTLATLGYGDVLPVGEMAKITAILITLIGQFYIAVFVAILLGKYLHSIAHKLS